MASLDFEVTDGLGVVQVKFRALLLSARSKSTSAGALKISVLAPDLFLRPKRRLNGASSFMLQVGDNSGPILDAAFSPRQLPLRFLELALSMAHTLALDWIELSVNGHMGFRGYRLRQLRAELFPSGC